MNEYSLRISLPVEAEEENDSAEAAEAAEYEGKHEKKNVAK